VFLTMANLTKAERRRMHELARMLRVMPPFPLWPPEPPKPPPISSLYKTSTEVLMSSRSKSWAPSLGSILDRLPKDTNVDDIIITTVLEKARPTLKICKLTTVNNEGAQLKLSKYKKDLEKFEESMEAYDREAERFNEWLTNIANEITRDAQSMRLIGRITLAVFSNVIDEMGAEIDEYDAHEVLPRLYSYLVHILNFDPRILWKCPNPYYEEDGEDMLRKYSARYRLSIR